MAEGPDPNLEEKEEDDWLSDTDQVDVTIFYSEENEYRVSKTILNDLDKEGISYIHSQTAIIPGSFQYPSIAKAIRKSKKVLLILSKTAMEVKFSLETYLALEQGLQTGRLTLMLLLIDGLTTEEVPQIPFLQQSTNMVLVDNYHERCMDNLCRTIKREVTLSKLLPAGNFAIGMAWSHFAGYLKLILPELPAAVQKSDFFQNNLGRMSTVLFMLCPTSATGPELISDGDKNVEHIGRITIKVEGREYTPTVYKVRGKNKHGNFEEYFCCAEYPSAFCAIGAVGEILRQMTQQQRHLEVQRFQYKMEEILNHDRNEQCRGRAKMLCFNDEGKGEESTASHHLFKAVRESIEKNLLHPMDGPEVVITEQTSKDVCFLYCDDSAIQKSGPDHKTVTRIRNHVEQNGIKCSIARPNNDPPAVIEERVKEARWVLCLISPFTMKSKTFLELWLAALLQRCIEEGKLNILILLSDTDSTKIPNFIQWVTYIDITRETSHLNRILDIVKGRTVSMQSQVPVGDVAYGLAWSFHVNYLRYVLPDFRERFDDRLKEDDLRKETTNPDKIRKCRYLLEIVPESCDYKNILPDVDNRIQGPYKVEPIQRNKAGTAARVYPCNMYKIAGERYDYFFAGEMLTPVRPLKEMHTSMIAGLSQKEMVSQSDRIVYILRSILDSENIPPDLRHRCKFIKFNDVSSDLKLADVIMEEIDREQNDVTRYADWEARERSKS